MNPLKALTNYSSFMAELLHRSTVDRSTAAVWSDSRYTGIAEREVFFSNGIRLRLREELDFDAGQSASLSSQREGTPRLRLPYHRLRLRLSLCYPPRPQSPLRLLQRLQSYHRQRRCAKPQSTDAAHAKKKRGQGRYGYRSLPLQLADPIRRFSLILLDDFLPANDREEIPATTLLLQLPIFYPDLEIDAVAGDAGLGYDIFLHTVYAKLRAHQTDQDKTLWPLRGYDDGGRPR